MIDQVVSRIVNLRSPRLKIFVSYMPHVSIVAAEIGGRITPLDPVGKILGGWFWLSGWGGRKNPRPTKGVAMDKPVGILRTNSELGGHPFGRGPAERMPREIDG